MYKPGESDSAKIPSDLSGNNVSLLDLQIKMAQIEIDKREEILKDFWEKIEQGTGTPIIEKNHSGNYMVTFLYRSKDEVKVELDCNDLNEQKLDLDGKIKTFEKIPGTNIYMFKLENIPDNVIIPYGITVTGYDGIKHDMQDQLNKKTFHLPLCNLDNGETFLDKRNSSVLVLPNANPEQTWYKGEISDQRGSLQTQYIDAKEQGFGERKLWVYTPPDFNPKKTEAYKLMVITDGGTYTTLMKPHLDRQQKKNPMLRDTVIAFVGNVREGSVKYHPVNLVEGISKDDTDHRQYEFLDHSEEFYAAVIAPTIERLRQDPTLHLSNKAEDTILTGFSLGGHFAAEAGLAHPENIGNVICLSGAFNTSIKSLGTQLKESNRKHGLNIFMSIGQLETLRQTPDNQAKYSVTAETRLEANQRFFEELQRNGHNVEFISLPSGHNELSTIHVITDQALPFVCANKPYTKDEHSELLQPSEKKLLEARERMQNFRAMSHKAPDLTASQDEIKKDDSSITPFTTTAKPSGIN
ncbi:alpha/beta hydrolase-fold protein [Legionella sp. 227]|uniref:alpha/beta hydrolase-fold protein n=1 Tax=Legionella sp. 227 TaxID=3367288 RepID=UPI00370D292F